MLSVLLLRLWIPRLGLVGVLGLSPLFSSVWDVVLFFVSVLYWQATGICEGWCFFIMKPPSHSRKMTKAYI